jgi:hypothetical protein
VSYHSLIRFHFILFVHIHIGGAMRLSKNYPRPQQQQQQQQQSQFYQPTAPYGLYFLSLITNLPIFLVSSRSTTSTSNLWW